MNNLKKNPLCCIPAVHLSIYIFHIGEKLYIFTFDDHIGEKLKITKHLDSVSMLS